MYVITDGTQYLAMEKTVYCVTPDFSLAYRWKAEEKARNMLKCPPKIIKNKGFFVQEVAAARQSIAVKPEQAVALADCGIPEITRMLDEVKALIGKMENVTKLWAECNMNISYQDKLQEDLLHQLEFESIAHGNGMHIAAQLKAVRVKRRAYKDMLIMFDQVMGVTPAQASIHCLDTKQQKLLARLYAPRTNEVFQ